MLSQLDLRYVEIFANIKAEIHTSFRKLQDILDARKTEVIKKLHQITETKLNKLLIQRDQFETAQAQLESCLLFVKESLRPADQRQVLIMRGTVSTQVQKLTTIFESDTISLNTSHFLLKKILLERVKGTESSFHHIFLIPSSAVLQPRVSLYVRSWSNISGYPSSCQS